MPDSGFIGITAFVFGVCIGSFLNVCIYRIPRSKSVIRPASMCPRCKRRIRFYDNIPLFSYLWLKGRCRDCGTPIPIRYLLVEMMGGGVAAAVFFRFGLTFEGLFYYAFITALIVISLIDMTHKMIPDRITLTGIPIGFLASFARPGITSMDAALGILAGGGSLFIVAAGYYLIAKKEGMGGGDIKLLAMIGAMIGWKGVFFTIFAASAVGTLTGIFLMLRTKSGIKMAIPFGPFLSIGAITYIFFGDQMILWYFNLP